jgi:hypothetical protein
MQSWPRRNPTNALIRVAIAQQQRGANTVATIARASGSSHPSPAGAGMGRVLLVKWRVRRDRSSSILARRIPSLQNAIHNEEGVRPCGSSSIQCRLEVTPSSEPKRRWGVSPPESPRASELPPVSESNKVFHPLLGGEAKQAGKAHFDGPGRYPPSSKTSS